MLGEFDRYWYIWWRWRKLDFEGRANRRVYGISTSLVIFGEYSLALRIEYIEWIEYNSP